MSILPTAKTQPKPDLADLTVLVYGQTKIGKSTFCAQSEGALFLATEPGLNALDVYQVPVQSWDDLLNACAELDRREATPSRLSLSTRSTTPTNSARITS